MLFQDGRRDEALPYIQDAARRGDPRSEYLLGIAHFNGDIVSKDWVRAYALVTMANSQGLPQAAPALAQMDQNIPLAERQLAAGLAVDLQRQAEAARARELAAADLGTGLPTPGPATAARAAVSPTVAAARAAVAEASQATGTQSPADAGASYARPTGTVPALVAAEPPPPPQSSVRPAATATSASGPWRVQLGAFSLRENADRLWSKLSGRSELAGKAQLMIPAGRVTKLQAGGYPSREAADGACRSLKRAGQDCLVTR
jgi:cell division septation protein DedD